MGSQSVTFTNKQGKQFQTLEIFDDALKHKKFYLGYRKIKLILEHITDIKQFANDVENKERESLLKKSANNQ